MTAKGDRRGAERVWMNEISAGVSGEAVAGPNGAQAWIKRPPRVRVAAAYLLHPQCTGPAAFTQLCLSITAKSPSLTHRFLARRPPPPSRPELPLPERQLRPHQRASAVGPLPPIVARYGRLHY